MPLIMDKYGRPGSRDCANFLVYLYLVLIVLALSCSNPRIRCMSTCFGTTVHATNEVVPVFLCCQYFPAIMGAKCFFFIGLTDNSCLFLSGRSLCLKTSRSGTPSEAPWPVVQPTITNGTCRYAVAPKCLFWRKSQSLGSCTSCNDQGVGQHLQCKTLKPAMNTYLQVLAQHTTASALMAVFLLFRYPYNALAHRTQNWSCCWVSDVKPCWLYEILNE